MNEKMKGALVPIVIVWIVGFGLAYILLSQQAQVPRVRALGPQESQATLATFGGALALALLILWRPSLENKVALAISVGGALGLWSGEQMAALIGFFGSLALPFLFNLAVSRKTPAKPAKPAAQAPPQLSGGGGVEFRARVEQTGGVPGLDQLETLASIATGKPETVEGQLATQLTQAVLARSLIALGVQPRISRPPEPIEPEGFQMPELRSEKLESPLAGLLTRGRRK